MKKICSLLLISFMIIGLFSVFNFNVKSQVVGSGSIDSGLVGYWRLDNNVLDSSGNGFSGSLVGATYINGYFNKALNFSNPSANINNMVTIPTNIQLAQIGNISFGYSFNVWVYPLIQSQGDRIIETESTAYPITLILNGANELYLNVYNGSTQTQIMGHINSNIWSMITCIRDVVAHTFSIYINGVLNVTGNDLSPNSSVMGTDSYRIGQTTGLNRGFNGLIDDIRFYNRTLSNSEISTLYNGEIITVTHDSGSTITPNGTVLVGVDQNQTFSIGVNSGYVNWVNYFDNVPLAPSSLYLLSGVQSTHNLFITSQFIGDNPTNTPILIIGLPINSFTGNIGNFPYLAQLLLVSGIIIMLMLSMLYLKKRGKL